MCVPCAAHPPLQEASNVQAVEVDADAEALRSAVEHAAKDHADDHFPAGVSTVCTCV